MVFQDFWTGLIFYYQSTSDTKMRQMQVRAKSRTARFSAYRIYCFRERIDVKSPGSFTKPPTYFYEWSSATLTITNNRVDSRVIPGWQEKMWWRTIIARKGRLSEIEKAEKQNFHNYGFS